MRLFFPLRLACCMSATPWLLAALSSDFRHRLCAVLCVNTHARMCAEQGVKNGGSAGLQTDIHYFAMAAGLNYI